MRVTASLGLCALSADVAGAAALVDCADQALYTAKRSGRNRVCEFSVGGAAVVHRDATPANAAAGTDVLTGCLLPAAFQDRYDALLRAAQAAGGVLGAVKFGLDSYRTLQAGAGQAVADAALRALAELLRKSVRPQDLLVRLDAEHFGVIAPGMSINDVLLFAERVRWRVERDGLGEGHPASGQPGRATVSAGVDALPASAPGATTLIERAGKALLRARRDGANRVHRFAPAAAPGPGQKQPDAAELMGEPAA